MKDKKAGLKALPQEVPMVTVERGITPPRTLLDGWEVVGVGLTMAHINTVKGVLEVIGADATLRILTSGHVFGRATYDVYVRRDAR